MHFSTNILEFDKVLQLVINKAQTSLGKEQTSNITPTNNSLVIDRKLKETKHAFDILTLYQEPPFGGVRNLVETLKRAHIYSVLKPTDFLDVVALIDAINNNIRFYAQVKEHEIEGNALDEYYYNLSNVPHLKKEIEFVITPEGTIYDNATSDLSKIRSKIQRNQQKVQEKLNMILNKESKKLAESLITIRGDRFVLPVKVSDKNNFNGTIIDYSSSGETVFMEPTIINQINNEISSLKADEIREMDKILRALTVKVGDHYDALINNLNILTDLDVIYAKARFAIEFECTMPKITEETVNLIKARHPLIDQKEVVPNTITFEKGERIIIITGPNTGGKTVALKTMGLLSLMVQSGMLIPVQENSETIIFEHVFADIGDEQSIEQSLSTFSSHMTRIIDILDKLTVGSLILLDELGSGTDPKEGASLAISILDYIRVRGVYVIATTHYPELKAYAYNKEEIINASVEFNVNTLSPTYRLLLGTPGKSNALLISERLGLKQQIIDAAKENVLTSKSEVTDLINKLEKQGNKLDQTILEYEDKIEQSKLLVRENEQLQKELLKEKRELSRKNSHLKSQIIIDTKAEALRLIQEIEEARKNDALKEHEIAALKHKVALLNQEEVSSSSTTDHVYQVGDQVNVLRFNRIGELVKKQKKDNWIVKMGTLTSQFNESQFEFVESKSEEKVPQSKMKTSIKKHVSPELDLRGMRYEEASIALDKYIDDCVMSNIPHATIIHGFGTLTLRKLVKEYLSANHQIQRHRDGEGNEGGNGVTIVYFK